jgi:serine/threonine-protein kinase HipA
MPNQNLLNLSIFGGKLGVLAYREDLAQYALELDPAFVASKHELSPLKLSLETFSRGPRVFKLGDTPFPDGLPGLIADSLPDSWGDKLLLAEVPGMRTSIERLSAMGERGPGAISFSPVLGGGANLTTTEAVLSKLAKDAARIQKTPKGLTPEGVDEALKKGGSPLGGYQPKVSAHLPLGGADQHTLEKILVGGATPVGHHPCIVKLSPEIDEGGGAIEYCFWKMAKKATIDVSPACLIFDGERRHFATARFDRHQTQDGTWKRRHVHTLSGFLHKHASDLSIDYEEFLRLTRTLCGAAAAEECLRRILFNLLSTNRDDHGRNHSYLYDEVNRSWALSPAYDLTPNVCTVFIALSWQGTRELPTQFEQVLALAATVGIHPRKVQEIYEQVEEATLGSWETLAAEVEVPIKMIKYWKDEMERQTKPLRENFRSKRKR